jgi:hypothetical protein
LYAACASPRYACEGLQLAKTMNIEALTKRPRKIHFALGLLIVGFFVFASVTAFARHRPRTFFYEVFEGMAGSYVDKLFGDKFYYAHLSFVHGTTALLHAFFLALLIFLTMLSVPKLSRRGALLICIFLVVIDIALLVFVFPDPNGAHYERWLYG